VPLHVTTRQGHVAVLEYLCSAGANVNLRDNVSTELDLCINNNNNKIVLFSPLGKGR
jgi:ankyrin repeat protein